MIDIIIPLYNSKETISKTLYSILLQKNIEDLHVYLVDDASDCSYEEILSFFSKKMDLHYYRLDKNSGPGVAREYGMEQSHSPYIVFCDSDDVFYDTFALKNLFDFTTKGKYDVSIGMVVEKFYNTINWYPVRFDVLHSKIYKRSFLQKKQIVFPNFYNAEDLAFNNLVLMSGASVGCCNYDTVYAYVRRLGSLTQTHDYYDNKHIRCFVESLKWSVSYAEDHSYPKENIAKNVMDSFAYLYFYFINDFHAKTIKYVISAISIYDKYSSFMKKEDCADSLEYWMRYLDNKKHLSSFKEFISFCHSKEGDNCD